MVKLKVTFKIILDQLNKETLLLYMVILKALSSKLLSASLNLVLLWTKQRYSTKVSQWTEKMKRNWMK